MQLIAYSLKRVFDGEGASVASMSSECLVARVSPPLQRPASSRPNFELSRSNFVRLSYLTSVFVCIRRISVSAGRVVVRVSVPRLRTPQGSSAVVVCVAGSR